MLSHRDRYRASGCVFHRVHQQVEQDSSVTVLVGHHVIRKFALDVQLELQLLRLNLVAE
jgi:hypothetical protein